MGQQRITTKGGGTREELHKNKRARSRRREIRMGASWERARGVATMGTGAEGVCRRRRDRFVALLCRRGITPPPPFPAHMSFFQQKNNPHSLSLLSLSLSSSVCVSPIPLSWLSLSLSQNLLCFFRPGKFLVVSRACFLAILGGRHEKEAELAGDSFPTQCVRTRVSRRFVRATPSQLGHPCPKEHNTQNLPRLIERETREQLVQERPEFC